MRITKSILFIFFVLTSFVAWAQGGLQFLPAEWNFGSIRESDGRVSHIFTGTNRGTKPVVILDVVSTCGCTIPEFSRKPIAPGATVQIKVVYDPANRPGAFVKELGVFSSERSKVATLVIRGSVVPRRKSIEELYPIDAGGGVRLSETLCSFAYIYMGAITQGTIGYVNTSSRAVALKLRPEQTSGLLRVMAPATVAAGARGVINFAYLISPSDPHYGTVRDVLGVEVDGRSNGTVILTHGIAVDSVAAANQSAPKAVFSENMLKFGPVKHGGALQRLPFTIANEGMAPLIIRAVENEGRVATTLMPGQRIAAGEVLRAEVMLDPKRADFGTLVDHLVVVTNDASRPMRRIRITAVIEE